MERPRNNAMQILTGLVVFILFLASPVWAGETDERAQEISLDNFKFQPINSMERSVPPADFEFEPESDCLCSVAVLYKPAKGSAGMWVSDRSWFHKPEHLKKYDRMLSVLDGKADVNNLGLDSRDSFFCWEGEPWISGVFKEIEAPLFPAAEKTRAFILRPEGFWSNFCEPSRLVILARKEGYFVMIQEVLDDSFSKKCWDTDDGKKTLPQYFENQELRAKAISRSRELADLFKFKIVSP